MFVHRSNVYPASSAATTSPQKAKGASADSTTASLMLRDDAETRRCFKPGVIEHVNALTADPHPAPMGDSRYRMALQAEMARLRRERERNGTSAGTTSN